MVAAFTKIPCKNMNVQLYYVLYNGIVIRICNLALNKKQQQQKINNRQEWNVAVD